MRGRNSDIDAVVESVNGSFIARSGNLYLDLTSFIGTKTLLWDSFKELCKYAEEYNYKYPFAREGGKIFPMPKQGLYDTFLGSNAEAKSSTAYNRVYFQTDFLYITKTLALSHPTEKILHIADQSIPDGVTYRINTNKNKIFYVDQTNSVIATYFSELEEVAA